MINVSIGVAGIAASIYFGLKSSKANKSRTHFEWYQILNAAKQISNAN